VRCAVTSFYHPSRTGRPRARRRAQGFGVVRATARGAWRPQWQALVQQRHGSAPDDWAVIVADRGLYVTWRVARGWHPFVRINRQGASLTPMAHVRQPASRIRTRPGTHPTP